MNIFGPPTINARVNHIVEEVSYQATNRVIGYALPVMGWAMGFYESRRRIVTALRGRLFGMSIAAESTVVLDSGWVSDGHFICWNGLHGAQIAHPEHCPYEWHGSLKVHLCSPSLQTAAGVSLDDLPEEQAAACREVSDIGSEPVRWRLTEYLHPDLSVEEQNHLSIFMLELDHDES